VRVDYPLRDVRETRLFVRCNGVCDNGIARAISTRARTSARTIGRGENRHLFIGATDPFAPFAPFASTPRGVHAWTFRCSGGATSRFDLSTDQRSIGSRPKKGCKFFRSIYPRSYVVNDTMRYDAIRCDTQARTASIRRVFDATSLGLTSRKEYPRYISYRCSGNATTTRRRRRGIAPVHGWIASRRPEGVTPTRKLRPCGSRAANRRIQRTGHGRRSHRVALLAPGKRRPWAQSWLLLGA